MRHQPLRLLILGGSSEATALARALAGKSDVAPILSLAGRTLTPLLPPIPHRIGGFGGIDGLVDYLRHNRIDAMIDATHPFAARMSAHAAAASGLSGIPLATFTRRPWRPEPTDRWTTVTSLDEAALSLGSTQKRVFVTSGRLGLAAFLAAPQHHYLIRTIDPPAPADVPPDNRVILARGPFPVDQEINLLRAERIDVLVTKNSGGAASFDKLLAARALALPVILIAPPSRESGLVLHDLAAVLAWIEAQRGTP
ncbi:cobalt-precorrin-6A reductase [Lichenihabitans psoromatis]|uniref:cobalt-precorrin-6A reductase n=1 Tax=Lichenihabitans psoromatis TaxID=2528642 RepID=UPI001FDEB3A2|nr:cobalt-precorrin-6A reductase [Lichenihabitans psoromatis]